MTILPWGGGRRIRSIVNSITLMFKISSNRIYLHAIACHLDTGIRVPSCFFLVGVGGGAGQNTRRPHPGVVFCYTYGKILE